MAINLLQRYIDRMADYLAKQGEKIAQKALATRSTTPQSQNQDDAFGYAVFYNSEKVRKGYARPSRQATEPHKGYSKIGIKEGFGRDWLDEWIESYEPESKGFVLVVVNAAFYTVPLEKGTYRKSSTTKYRIISQIYSDMETLATKTKGTTRLLNKSVK